MKAVWILFLVVTLLKLHLLPLYHSTDFEVHRNWLAVTHSLPMSQWYTDTTSPWTLDYPPFFAYMEFFLSQLAVLCDPLMLHVHNLSYASIHTILFQRLSVCALDVILLLSVFTYTRLPDPEISQPRTLSTILITLLNPGLLIVDHIHFQYNGILLGIFIFSITAIKSGHDLVGATLFAALLNFKHIFAYCAPVYFFYLLGNYCFELKQPSFKNHEIPEYRKWSSRRFIALASIVVGIFALSLGPFIAMGQLKQLLTRLFPFKRGLSHSYWAPNIWALYNFADKLLTFLRNGTNSSMTRGLVGDVVHVILPAISPPLTMLLTILTMSPVLISLFRNPYPKTFLSALNYCLMCSFMLGWHVHEKAILMITVPLGLQALQSKFYLDLYTYMSLLGHYSLFPLLHTSHETLVKIILLIGHYIILHRVAKAEVSENLEKMRITEPPFGNLRRVYLFGIILLELFSSILQPLLIPRWEFLPLMTISVYCALGMLYSWGQLWNGYWQDLRRAQEYDS